MRVLIGCECSGIVRDAFRARGHDAWSCDLKPCERGSRFHYQTDVRNIILSRAAGAPWDLGIFFPECTDLCVSGARWFPAKRADGSQQHSIDFFIGLTNCAIPKWAIENPIGIMSTHYRKPDQIIQPWQFGHGETKATCFWLHGLPKLVPTDIVTGRENRVHRMAPSATRAADRARTYPGIARSMAEQWGQVLRSH